MEKENERVGKCGVDGGLAWLGSSDLRLSICMQISRLNINLFEFNIYHRSLKALLHSQGIQFRHFLILSHFPFAQERPHTHSLFPILHIHRFLHRFHRRLPQNLRISTLMHRTHPIDVENSLAMSDLGFPGPFDRVIRSTEDALSLSELNKAWG